MKVSHSEGVANHAGSESCGGVREDLAEALTGESTGQLLNREMPTSGRRRRGHVRKAISGAPVTRGALESCAVGEPVHVRKHPAREPGTPVIARCSRTIW